MAEEIKTTLAAGKIYCFHLHDGVMEHTRFYARDAHVHPSCPWILQMETDIGPISFDVIAREFYEG
jgi:hypothetical protein